MLKMMRKKGFAKKVLWFVAIIIIITFGFFGTASMLNKTRKNSYAGKIFGKKITFNIFNKTLQLVRVQAMIQYGDKFNKVLPFLNLNAETWDRLILLHETKKRHIKVSDDEVAMAIETYPFFQRNNKFDSNLYVQILQYWLRIKPRSFEEYTRDTIKLKKLYNNITSDISITEENILNKFKRDNEAVQVKYCLVSPDKFKSQVSFDESEAINYFEANKYSFAIPTSINVEYIKLPISKDTTKEEKKSLWEKMNNIYQDILDKQKFYDMENKYSVQIKTSGFFSAETPNLSLGWPYEKLNDILKLKDKNILAPFETDDGIIIARIKEKRDAYIPEYEEVKQKVKDVIISIKAQKIAKKIAEQYLGKIKNELSKTKLRDFTKAVKIIGLDVKQTPVFKRNQYLPEIGLSKDFQEAAFSLSNKNKLSGVVKTAKSYCILYLDSYIPADKEKYKEEKNKIAETMLVTKRNQAFNNFLTSLRLKANLEDNVSKLETAYKK